MERIDMKMTKGELTVMNLSGAWTALAVCDNGASLVNCLRQNMINIYFCAYSMGDYDTAEYYAPWY